MNPLETKSVQDRNSSTAGPVHDKRMERRAVASGSLGAALEFFDFTIYGLLSATLFPQLFFSDLGQTGGLLASFATFGVGFLARPLGAIVFGHLGDRVGRRPILYVTLLLMGLSSVAIGLLPIGGGAVVAWALVSLRFLQGFSLGGEITGNQLLAMEHAHPTRRGLMGAFISMGSPLSQVLANLTLVALTAMLPQEEFESWGWRIPFIASILLIAVTFYIRQRITETPAFLEAKAEAQELPEASHGGVLQVLKSYPGAVIKLILLWGGPTITFYIVAVYGLTALQRDAGYDSTTVFTILMIANGVSVIGCISGGWLGDRFGRKLPMTVGMIGAFIGATGFFLLGDTAGVFVVTLLTTLTLVSIQMLQGIQAALYAEQFPTTVRFAGSALGLQGANLLFGAPAPFVATVVAGAGGNAAILWVCLPLLALSMVVLSTIKDRRGQDMTDLS